MNDRIELGTGGLQLEIWALGARLNAVSFNGIGPLVAGSATREEALGAKQNHGAVVGPVANRIAGGTAEIGGRRFEFDRNEKGVTTCHSGTDGIHCRDWRVETSGAGVAVLTLDLADGEGRFPGNRRITARYGVEDSRFTLNFQAVTDAPTLMNLALHPYWALAGARGGQRIQVNADNYLPIDALKIPTGEIAEVGGVFDLRQMREASDAIDHNFCLSGPDGEPAVILESETLRLEIETDAPGVQIFTGRPFGIAIEPQHWPDAPNHANFPSILLEPGQTYRQESTYTFTRL